MASSNSAAPQALQETQPKIVLIIGASGVIGKRLVQALSNDGKYTVVAGLRKTPLPQSLLESGNVVCEMGIDLRNTESIEKLIEKYSQNIYAIWNLAAPLSVESENDPSVAEDTTVGGMSRLINAMIKYNVSESTRILFSDSIGSFGSEAPRNEATAKWLIENPVQDPGSEYGRQKRKCREMLQSSKYDTRWGIIPGVLHDDHTWGDGTTEYALGAIKAFHDAYQREGVPSYDCPVHDSSMLPMIHISDLVSGLVALMETHKSMLTEPTSGYSFAGFSFTPIELFDSLTLHFESKNENKKVEMNITYSPTAAALFAELWPNSISGKEALRDLGWKPTAVVCLNDAIIRILSSHDLNDSGNSD
mmetsp:Transcript_52463/g.67281  ORF Transcript_52463/g.67281 Transcript_52463/m.67281 type:complete len:362 (+) Transcript_52463:41-1126(+)